MDTLPRETHQEVVGRLAPEVRQVLRMTCKYFAELIQPQVVNFLEFGAEHNLLSYCGLGLSLKNPTTMVCGIAARHGHLEVLKWGYSNDCHWNSWTCAIAARYGHLDILEWARSQGCSWDKWTCAAAAEGGHLKVLKWARYQECLWDSGTCARAAMGGYLEVLKWAIKHGCPCDENVCYYAAEGGHLEVLQWTLEHGCPWNFRNVDISNYSPRIQEYITSLRA